MRRFTGSVSSSQEELARILESARRLGVEMDEAEALQWLTAMGAGAMGGDVVVDSRTGVFGHRVSMLDFTSTELDRFRAIGRFERYDRVKLSLTDDHTAGVLPQMAG